MGKYSNIDANVFSIFGSPTWTAENIKTYPANFVAMDAGTEFVRIKIIASGEGVNLKSASGVLIADIFVKAGDGPKRSSQIADKLDSYLSGKYLSTGSGTAVQLGSSSMTVMGLDPDNKSLYWTTCTIPFSYFEVM